MNKSLKPILKSTNDFTVKGAVIALINNIVKQFDAEEDMLIIKSIAKWLDEIRDGKIFI